MIEPYRLSVVLASVREGRIGPAVGGWFAGRAARRADVVVDVIDLAELRLPDDLSGTGDTAVLRKHIAAADAVVVVTPEYNHGYPGPLKTAIDSVKEGWAAKAVGFVSYGGVSGGLRAVEQLRPIFSELHAVTVREAVSFAHVHDRFDGKGGLTEAERADRAADRMLDQLGWWARALHTARERQPFLV